VLALLGSGSAASLAAPSTVVTPPGDLAARPGKEETRRTSKRFSDGDLAGQGCLRPLLASNGAAVSCSLLNERRSTAVTDF
jgi:hypothetical protein